MSMSHKVAPRFWPAGLSDRASVVSVFQAYGDGSHIAVIRCRNLPDGVSSELWVECGCGFSTAPIREDSSNFRSVFPSVEGAADQHVEQTRSR